MSCKEEGRLLGTDSSLEPEVMEEGRRKNDVGEFLGSLSAGKGGGRMEVGGDQEIVVKDEGPESLPSTPLRQHSYYRSSSTPSQADALADGAPPEWALLLLGCLLGLATGICVAAFNRGEFNI